MEAQQQKILDFPGNKAFKQKISELKLTHSIFFRIPKDFYKPDLMKLKQWVLFEENCEWTDMGDYIKIRRQHPKE